MQSWKPMPDMGWPVTYKSWTEATAGFGMKLDNFNWDIALADDFQTVYNVKYPVQVLTSFGYNF